MIFSSQLIITTIGLFEIAKCRQPWPSQGSIGPLSTPQKVDLEFCMVWPWEGRSILDMTVVKCKAHEKCVPLPDTQIYGLNLGYAVGQKKSTPPINTILQLSIYGCVILQKSWHSLYR